jgi:hypothetical protein
VKAGDVEVEDRCGQAGDVRTMKTGFELFCFHYNRRLAR